MGADGVYGQRVEVDADGVGVFGAGAGTDMHNMEFNIGEDGNYIEYESVGYDFAVDMTTILRWRLRGVRVCLRNRPDSGDALRAPPLVV